MRRISETKSALGRLLVVVVVVVMGLAAVSLIVPAAMAGSSHHASPASGLSQFNIAKAKKPTGKNYQFSNSFVSDLVASIGASALVVNALDNFAYQLVIWDSSTNTSTVVQAVVPGFSDSYPLSVVAAGGEFFFDFYNVTTVHPYAVWEEISPTSPYTVTNVTSVLPSAVGPSYLWTFVLGTTKDVYLTDEEGGFLVELKAPSLALVSNLSAALPAGLVISSVLPEGKLLYVAGEQLESAPNCNAYNCGAYGVFGVISSKTVKKVTTYTLTTIGTTGVSPTNYLEPANLSAGFASLAYIKPYVLVSGYLSIENLNPATYELALTGSYFFSYDTSTTTLTNYTTSYTSVSGNMWGIPAIEPFGKNVMLSASWYYVTCPPVPTPGCVYFGEPGYYTGAFYEWDPATSTMTNVTSDFPANYISGAFYVTAESSGYFFTGGSNTVTGYGEICSIKT